MSELWWRSLDQLDQEQANILTTIDNTEGTSFICGPPGSGKTNLLTLLLQKFVAQGARGVRLLVFNRLLRDHIAKAGAQYRLQSENVLTHMTFFREVVDILQLPKPEAGLDFDEEREYLSVTLHSALKNRSNSHLLDVLLVDEYQDYSDEEQQVFELIAKTRVYAGDDNQTIYKVRSAKKTASLRKLELTRSYRNGPRVCEFLDAVARPLPEHKATTPNCNYDEGRHGLSLVETEEHEDFEAMCIALRNALHAQQIAYPTEALAVLGPERAQVDTIRRELTQTLDTSSVTFATFYASKGLEFRCVHLCHLETVAKAGNRKVPLVYVAASRAQSQVTVHVLRNTKLPSFVKDALKSDTADKPLTLAQLFGQGE